MKCENFCNVHCAFDCPNSKCDGFEEYWDIPCEDAGLARIKCNDCYYNERYCTCEDCCFKHSENCPEIERYDEKR